MPSRRTVRLTGEEPVAIPGGGLTARISESSHKARAPIADVSVLFEEVSSARKTQVGWRIESGRIDHRWRELEGRRYDQASGGYVEERLGGWRVRLDSVDDQSAGGSPTAITISVESGAGRRQPE